MIINYYRISTLISFWILPCWCYGQSEVTWKDLADVTYTEKYFEEYGQKYLVPVFGATPTKKQGKVVVIKGYFIPLDETVAALSKNQFSSCFFCGASGPETVIEIQFTPEARKMYKVDQYIAFKGILRLNSDDVNHFNYILENAELSDL